MPVLIAEDDAALASLVRKGLEAEHYAVDVTTDGEHVRAMAGEMDYDLLMLDLNLPRADGITILRHLRTRKPSMPILLLTRRNRVEDLRNALTSAPTTPPASLFLSRNFRRIRALSAGDLPAAAC